MTTPKMYEPAHTDEEVEFAYGIIDEPTSERDPAVVMLLAIIEDSERAAKYSTEEGKAKFAARVEECRRLIVRLVAASLPPTASPEGSAPREPVDAKGKTFCRVAMAADFRRRYRQFNDGEPTEEFTSQYVEGWAANLTREGYTVAAPEQKE